MTGQPILDRRGQTDAELSIVDGVAGLGAARRDARRVVNSDGTMRTCARAMASRTLPPAMAVEVWSASAVGGFGAPVHGPVPAGQNAGWPGTPVMTSSRTMSPPAGDRQGSRRRDRRAGPACSDAQVRSPISSADCGQSATHLENILGLPVAVVVAPTLQVPELRRFVGRGMTDDVARADAVFALQET